MKMKYLKVLDLSQDSNLSEEDCRTLDKLSKRVREEYDSYIGELILDNKISENGLFLKVSSRNTLVSDLLKNFCDMALLEENIRLNKISKSVVKNEKDQLHPFIFFSQCLQTYIHRGKRLE